MLNGAAEADEVWEVVADEALVEVVRAISIDLLRWAAVAPHHRISSVHLARTSSVHPVQISNDHPVRTSSDPLRQIFSAPPVRTEPDLLPTQVDPQQVHSHVPLVLAGGLD